MRKESAERILKHALLFCAPDGRIGRRASGKPVHLNHGIEASWI